MRAKQVVKPCVFQHGWRNYVSQYIWQSCANIIIACVYYRCRRRQQNVIKCILVVCTASALEFSPSRPTYSWRRSLNLSHSPAPIRLYTSDELFCNILTHGSLITLAKCPIFRARLPHPNSFCLYTWLFSPISFMYVLSPCLEFICCPDDHESVWLCVA